MALLTGKNLLKSFEELTRKSKRIDVAVAWATACDAMEILKESAERGVKVRFIVGIDGNSTTPEALESLERFAKLGIGASRRGIFHPKVYLFHMANKTVCWVGSANFTNAGFGLHNELVHQFEDEGNAVGWFNRLWSESIVGAAEKIARYSERWEPTPRMPMKSKGASSVRRSRSRLDPVTFLQPSPKNWEGYVKALEKCEAYWEDIGSHFSIFNETFSYIHTISTGRDLLLRRTWTFNDEEIDILFPRREKAGAWGLLGSMRAAATATKRFKHNDDHVRKTIKAALRPVVEAKGAVDFINAAVDAIDEISALDRFAHGVATRLISLARPDFGVSVNKGSAPGLIKLTGLKISPDRLGLSRNYRMLLQWVFDQAWHGGAAPDDETQVLWSMRAALLDSFVYEPV